jgi:hypothetical protein
MITKQTDVLPAINKAHVDEMNTATKAMSPRPSLLDGKKKKKTRLCVYKS